MKRFLSFLTAGAIALGLVFSAPIAVAADEYLGEEGLEGAVVITIVHTNDIHGRFLPTGSVIGIDTVAAIYASLENAILVDAGDTIHGLPFVNLGQGQNAIELMNLAGYSLMAPGNHEFNFGWERLVELEGLANFPLTAANVLQDGAPLFQQFVVFEIAGVSVGFFGLTTPATPEATHPDNVIGLYFGCPVTHARNAVDALQSEGADVIIALAHLGVDGYAGWTSTRLAEEVEGLHLIVDGHSHTLFESGNLVGDVLIAQTGAHLSNVGIVEIVMLDGELVSITASVIDHEYARENFAPVADVTAALDRLNAEMDEALNEVVGYMPITLYGDSPEHRATLRGEEVLIGNLIADTMRWASGADLTLMNSGGIRYHFHAGDVTIGDVIEVLAFPNYIVVVEITPYLLREALENGVSNMPGNGRFPQVSGFSFVFDQFANDGERVLSISVDGEELDLNDQSTVFTLAINDFQAAGGDGYTTFVGLARVSEAGLQSEVFVDYLREVGLEGRIFELEGRIENVGVESVVEEEPAVEEEVVEYEALEEEVYVEEVLVEYEVLVEELVEETVEEEVEEVVVEEVVVVVEEPAPAPAPAPAGTGTVVNASFLNVRNASGIHGTAIAYLPAGTVVTILESAGVDFVWHRISYGNIEGWVFSGFIQLN